MDVFDGEHERVIKIIMRSNQSQYIPVSDSQNLEELLAKTESLALEFRDALRAESREEGGYVAAGQAWLVAHLKRLALGRALDSVLECIPRMAAKED